MTELHLDRQALLVYGSASTTSGPDDAVEAHLLTCGTCRSHLAEAVDESDLERSWHSITERLGVGGPGDVRSKEPGRFVDLDDPDPTVGRPSTEMVVLDAAERRGHRVPERRLRLVAAAVVLVIAAVAVWSTSRDAGEGVASSGAPGWVDVLPADADVHNLASRVTHVLSVTPWDDRLVVVTSSGDEKWAWVHEGDDWSRSRYEPPAGCDPHGGLVSVGDRLVISCSAADAGGVFVATTSDLAEWKTHAVAEAGGSFGTTIGPSPDGGVAVTLLEAVGEGDTTRGSGLRVWTSGDLESWTEIPGIDDGQMRDAAPQRVRSFGDTLIITGAVTVYPEGTGNAATWRPAVWVSRAGGPFTRIDVASDGTVGDVDGWIVDVAKTATGYVAVGGTGDGARPLAWTSADLRTWVPASFSSDTEGSGMLWSVAPEAGGALLAVSSAQQGDSSLTWSSTDDGSTWRVVGEGPDLLTRQGETVVGARSGDRLRVQRWESTDDSAASTKAEEDALVIDVGSIEDLEGSPDEVLVVPADGKRHPIFVVRDAAGIVALSARSPKQGCRIVFAADVLAENPGILLGRDAFFQDSCHGAVFDRMGSRTTGPSFRDMYRYDVEERDGRILVDTRLLRPGSWSAGIDQQDPPLLDPGETDAVAEHWRDIVEDVDGRRTTDPTLPFVLVLGTFHEPGTGLVTVPFTFSGAVAHLSVGPATVHPPEADPDDPAVETYQVAEGTVVVESGTGPGPDDIRLSIDLADGLRLRVDIQWGFEDDPISDLVSVIDQITRTAT